MGMDGRDTINAETYCGSTGHPAERNIEVWLRESLACTYNEVLSESLPDSWLALIDKTRLGN
jgi:hypothetical protein